MNDILNFEDISLSDQVSSYPSKPRPALRSAQTTTGVPRRSTSSTNLAGHSRGLRITASHNAARSRNSWQPDPASSPVLAYSGRRTPSPSKSPTMPNSPRSPQSTASTPRLGHETSPIFPSTRPQSWQQQKPQQKRRKSAKEIEQDFHDSDDDLPEDSFLFNIPMTPRPFHERAPSTPLPRHPSSHRLSRTASWQVALADLSPDARKLTVALEAHSDTLLSPVTPTSTAGDDASSTHSTPRSASRPSLAARSKTVAVLPPVRKGNPLVDPLPCSKEKEAHLSRTRPSWLPPKCQKEERRHLKEYQKMMGKIAALG